MTAVSDIRAAGSARKAYGATLIDGSRSASTQRRQTRAVALFYDQLNQHCGRCPVLLVPVSCGLLVKQLYAWGARNCEMHVAQSHGPAQVPAGVIMPTFLPETG